jgi:hypothetical protein
MPGQKRQLSNSKWDAIFEARHGDEVREYYGPVRSMIGSTLSRSSMLGFSLSQHLRTEKGDLL